MAARGTSGLAQAGRNSVRPLCTGSFGQHAKLFDAQASAYATFRPNYADEIFNVLIHYHVHGCLASGTAQPSSGPPATEAGFGLAADIAAGSGQASFPLARWFDEVAALDASAEQVAAGQTRLEAGDSSGGDAAPSPHSARLAFMSPAAEPIPDSTLADPEVDSALKQQSGRVSFSQGTSEATGLPDASADMVLAAQALHWFDVPAFYAEAHRVLKPGGTVAVVGYGFPSFPELEEADTALRGFDSELAEHWNVAKRSLVIDLYRGLDPPEADSAADTGVHSAVTHPDSASCDPEQLKDACRVRPRRYSFSGMPCFQGVARATLVLEARLTVDEAIGYLGTWSGYQSLIRKHGEATALEKLGVVKAALASSVKQPGVSSDSVLVAWPVLLSLGKRPL